MASIIIQFVEKTDGRNLNPPATGSNVAAWKIDKFVQTPADGKYPTTQTPDATGTTDAGGNCTLTGLTSSDLYYVSIVDAGTKPHWTQPLVAGSGANNRLTYVPAPVAAATPTPPASGSAFLGALQLATTGSDFSSVEPNFYASVAPWTDISGNQHWWGSLTTPPQYFAGSGATIVRQNESGFINPAFTTGDITGTVELFIHDVGLTPPSNIVLCKKAFTTITSPAVPGIANNLKFDNTDVAVQVGTDIFVDTSPGDDITSNAGDKLYVVTLQVFLTGELT